MFSKAKCKTPVRMDWVTISNKQAEQLLENTRVTGFPQRKVASATVSKYVKEMRNGTWHGNTADVIRLCEYRGKTVILDGQHRVTASVKAEVPLTTWVAFGVPEEAFKYVDQGAPRTLAHVMDSANWPAANVLAPVAVMLLEDQKGLCPVTAQGADGSSGTAFDRVAESFPDLPAMWNSYGGLIKSAGKYHGSNLIFPAVGGFFFYQAKKVDHDEAVAVLRYLAEPMAVSAPSGIWELAREELVGICMEAQRLKALGNKPHSQSTKKNQLQVLRFAWLCHTQGIAKPRNSSGFKRSMTTWLKKGGSDEPWGF